MFKLAKGSWWSLRLHVRVLGNFMIILPFERNQWIYDSGRTTVDGGNPAPVDMVNIPLFIGFLTIPGGAGFLPSTVPSKMCQQTEHRCNSWKSLWNFHRKVLFQWSPMQIAMSLARYSHLTSLRSANYHLLVNILTFHKADKTWY